MELNEFKELTEQYMEKAREFVKENKAERGIVLSITYESSVESDCNATLSAAGSISNLAACIGGILSSEDLRGENMMAMLDVASRR